MLSCPRCNAQFYQDTRICPQCGLSDPVVFCPGCNNPFDMRYANCTVCGTPIDRSAFFQQSSTNTENNVNSSPRKNERLERNFGRKGNPKLNMIRIIIACAIIAAIVILCLSGLLQRKKNTIVSSVSTVNNSSGTQSDASSSSSFTPIYYPDDYIDSANHGDNQSLDEYRTINMENPIGLNLLLCKVARTSFNRLGFMSLSEQMDWIEENGASYEINKLSEKHDPYGRYLLKIDYRISRGSEWENHQGFMYSRYNETTQVAQGNYTFFSPDEKTLLEVINWNKDVPYDADVQSVLNFQRDKTSEMSSISDSEKTNTTDLITYNITNAYNDDKNTMGYVSFEYKGYEFEFSTGKLEDGRISVEGWYKKIGSSDEENTHSFGYIWETYEKSGEFVVDNSGKGHASGVYPDNNPSILNIAIDTNDDKKWFGRNDFMVSFNAETNEILELDTSGNYKQRLATIIWPTEFSYPPK